MAPIPFSSPGAAAQASGNSAQLDFDVSLAQYKLLGLAWGQHNYPKITQRGNQAIVIGKATTDYTVFVAGCGAAQLEVKTWNDRDTHSMSFEKKEGFRLRQQYLMMLDFAPFVFTAYLVLWRYKGLRNWRLYPVLEITNLGNGLFFKREKGILVQEAEGGWPRWVEGVMGVL